MKDRIDISDRAQNAPDKEETRLYGMPRPIAFPPAGVLDKRADQGGSELIAGGFFFRQKARAIEEKRPVFRRLSARDAAWWIWVNGIITSFSEIYYRK